MSFIRQILVVFVIIYGFDALIPEEGSDPIANHISTCDTCSAGIYSLSDCEDLVAINESELAAIRESYECAP